MKGYITLHNALSNPKTCLTRTGQQEVYLVNAMIHPSHILRRSQMQ